LFNCEKYWDECGGIERREVLFGWSLYNHSEGFIRLVVQLIFDMNGVVCFIYLYSLIQLVNLMITGRKSG
jgi:hypothetical protein